MAKTVKVEVPNTNGIVAYLHCALCVKERPKDVSMQEFAHLDVGWTKQGIQVWCVRHDCNVLHVDFEGYKHLANTTRKEK